VPGLDRLIYVDDSGRPQSGLVVYGWVEFAPDRWAGVLRDWLDLRKRLWRESGIPVTQELHTVDYVNGRGRISRKFPDRHRHNDCASGPSIGAVGLKILRRHDNALTRP
jgi:hypothetical protein